MIFQVENALAQAEPIQREHRESVARDPITFFPTDVIRNRIPIPNVSLPSQIFQWKISYLKKKMP